MKDKHINQRNIGPVIRAQGIDNTSRRHLLGRIGAATAISLTTGANLGSFGRTSAKAGQTQEEHRGDPPLFDGDSDERVREALLIREHTAEAERDVPVDQQLTNGDEQRYLNYIGACTKGLPHDAPGLVNRSAFEQLIAACNQRTGAAFESVTLSGYAQLLNPMCGVAFELEGADSHHTTTLPPPTLASAARADEAVEAYWMALCRDIPFSGYATNSLVVAAAAELSTFSAFTGPKQSGSVTAKTLFRGFTPSDIVGPYVSQFLLRPFIFDTYPVGTGQVNVAELGIDYATDQSSWFNIQNGFGPSPFTSQIDPQLRYIRNGRDLATFVHLGGEVGPFAAALNWLTSVNAPMNPGNPYLRRTKQMPLITFGNAQFVQLIGEIYYRALKAAWYHKYFIHRTIRPEEYGGLVHLMLSQQANYPVHSDILKSKAIAETFKKNGTYLLSQAYPEGCPILPAYPSGHGTSAGAAATLLKAAFDGSVALSKLNSPIPVVTASEDGLSLVPYAGADAEQLTVNSEINKIAANIAFGRNFAGIHWRSDNLEGIKLGEAMAISILRDQKSLYKGENFAGFTITKFDGETITI